MPRFARVVVLGEPYHITHRGNHRADVFFEDEHREVYLAMLAAACARFDLEVWAYCLMTNHVHVVAVPRLPLSLAGGVGRTHMRDSRWLNLLQKCGQWAGDSGTSGWGIWEQLRRV